MKISDCLMILAVLLGPIIAVQVQKFIEKATEKRRNKIHLFKTLMATRGTTLAQPHVEALNKIDLEFNGSRKKDIAVVESWKIYLDHLGLFFNPEDPDYNTKLNAWTEKGKDLLADLLYTMAESLGYHFDKVLLKRGAYSPRGHVEQDWDNVLIRKYLMDVLRGVKNIPIWIRGMDHPEEVQPPQTESQPVQKPTQS